MSNEKEASTSADAQAPVALTDEVRIVLMLCIHELKAWIRDHGQDIRSKHAIERAQAILAAPIASALPAQDKEPT